MLILRECVTPYGWIYLQKQTDPRFGFVLIMKVRRTLSVLVYYCVTKVTLKPSMQVEAGFVVGSARKALIMLFAHTDAGDAP